MVTDAGILTWFLPPYSPDLMPIEEAFSYMKSYIRKDDELLQVISSPKDVTTEAFHSIATEFCNSWITRAGYV